MTPEEKQMIDGLVQRVQNTPLAEKDDEAEQLLQQGLGRNPNALYVLAQTVLVQGYALEQAQKQLADAKQAIEQLKQQQHTEPKHATSFLGSLFGAGDSAKPAPPPPPPQAQYAPVPSYTQPQAYSQPAYTPTYAPPSQGGGFLRGAAQTAAGVAAGALAFEGIESLMHGFGGGGGGSAFGGGGFGGGAPREEIINNYYGDDSGRERDHESHGFAGNDGGLAGNSDIEDRRDDAASQTDFADTGDQDTGDDAASSDDFASNDDSSFGGGDDSGSDDSSFS